MKAVNFLFLIFCLHCPTYKINRQAKRNELIQYELKSNRFGVDDKGPWKLLTN